MSVERQEQTEESFYNPTLNDVKKLQALNSKQVEEINALEKVIAQKTQLVAQLEAQLTEKGGIQHNQIDECGQESHNMAKKDDNHHAEAELVNTSNYRSGMEDYFKEIRHNGFDGKADVPSLPNVLKPQQHPHQQQQYVSSSRMPTTTTTTAATDFTSQIPKTYCSVQHRPYDVCEQFALKGRCHDRSCKLLHPEVSCSSSLISYLRENDFRVHPCLYATPGVCKSFRCSVTKFPIRSCKHFQNCRFPNCIFLHVIDLPVEVNLRQDSQKHPCLRYGGCPNSKTCEYANLPYYSCLEYLIGACLDPFCCYFHIGSDFGEFRFLDSTLVGGENGGVVHRRKADDCPISSSNDFGQRKGKQNFQAVVEKNFAEENYTSSSSCHQSNQAADNCHFPCKNCGRFFMLPTLKQTQFCLSKRRPNFCKTCESKCDDFASLSEPTEDNGFFPCRKCSTFFMLTDSEQNQFGKNRTRPSCCLKCRAPKSKAKEFSSKKEQGYFASNYFGSKETVFENSSKFKSNQAPDDNCYFPCQNCEVFFMLTNSAQIEFCVSKRRPTCCQICESKCDFASTQSEPTEENGFFPCKKCKCLFKLSDAEQSQFLKNRSRPGCCKICRPAKQHDAKEITSTKAACDSASAQIEPKTEINEKQNTQQDDFENWYGILSGSSFSKNEDHAVAKEVTDFFEIAEVSRVAAEETVITCDSEEDEVVEESEEEDEVAESEEKDEVAEGKEKDVLSSFSNAQLIVGSDDADAELDELKQNSDK